MSVRHHASLHARHPALLEIRAARTNNKTAYRITFPQDEGGKGKIAMEGLLDWDNLTKSSVHVRVLLCNSGKTDRKERGR